MTPLQNPAIQDHVKGSRGLLGNVILQFVRVGFEERHRQVAGEDVIKRRDVSRALDGGMPAQCQNSASRPSYSRQIV